ncbi:MAG: tRNA pseudouridine(38-40) synthase TruA [Sumerlaeia bacterium]
MAKGRKRVRPKIKRGAARSDCEVTSQAFPPPVAPGDLARVALLIEYDGGPFVGLQVQDTGPSIQGVMEDAARLLGSGEPDFRAAGRTDAGVHARGQVICLRVPAHLARANLRDALNWHLPETVRVRRVALCGEEFDPRRDARRRTYRYLLSAGQPLPPLMRGRMGRVKASLDLDRMRAAACELLGRHDFREWRSTQCQAHRTVLDMERVEVEPWFDPGPHGQDAQTFAITVACRSFLHRMVRYLVGGLVQAGRGALTPEELRLCLAEVRLPAGVVPAPPEGLSLERVDYAEGCDPFDH